MFSLNPNRNPLGLVMACQANSPHRKSMLALQLNKTILESVHSD